MQVVPINKNTAKYFVERKHYSKSIPFFSYGFALVENDLIEGVTVFSPPLKAIEKYAFNSLDIKIYELSRLVIQSETRNAGSYLVSQSLKMLDRPCAVISYADKYWNHCGIIYQSTNWFYTGANKSHDNLYLVDGKYLHTKTIIDKYKISNPTKWARDNNIPVKKPQPKHRYFQFCGSKKERKEMWNDLRYPIFTKYPKCDKINYDSGEKIVMRKEKQLSIKELF